MNKTAKTYHLKAGIILVLASMLSACTGIPENIKPVENFDADRYLGTWYEIARFDHKFEKNLQRVSANYQRDNDGGIIVTNKGYNPITGKWKTANGKAYFTGKNDTAHLKVSFFGPFYGSYIVFELDEESYQYAFVTSYNKDYLWLLARNKSVDKETLNYFIKTANEKGFNTDNLLFITH